MTTHPRCDQPTVYWEWVRSEAALIDSDGCSKVSGWHVECCWEHDLAFQYGRDPRDAYRRYRHGALDPWRRARLITFEESNRRFRNCHVPRTKLGWLNPAVWWRWRGVVRLSRSAWDEYRARDRAKEPV